MFTFLRKRKKETKTLMKAQSNELHRQTNRKKRMQIGCMYELFYHSLSLCSKRKRNTSGRRFHSRKNQLITIENWDNLDTFLSIPKKICSLPFFFSFATLHQLDFVSFFGFGESFFCFPINYFQISLIDLCFLISCCFYCRSEIQKAKSTKSQRWKWRKTPTHRILNGSTSSPQGKHVPPIYLIIH